MTAIAFLAVCAVFIPTNAFAREKKSFVVVIDAGHGGKDVGATEYNVNEKDVNLAVALKLGDLIKKKLKDTKVIYTRDEDKFVTLQGRADIANKAKADLFISIHCNSVDKANPNRATVVGVSTWLQGENKNDENMAVSKRENAVIELDANDRAHFKNFDSSDDIMLSMNQQQYRKNSLRFAKYVQDEMKKIGRNDRGIKEAGFWVLWATAMPSALIELDFICNPEQAKFLGSKDGQEKLAGAIFNAVKSYESFFRSSIEAQISDRKNKNKNDNLTAQATDYDAHSDTPEYTSSSTASSKASKPASNSGSAVSRPSLASNITKKKADNTQTTTASAASSTPTAQAPRSGNQYVSKPANTTPKQAEKPKNDNNKVAKAEKAPKETKAEKAQKQTKKDKPDTQVATTRTQANNQPTAVSKPVDTVESVELPPTPDVKPQQHRTTASTTKRVSPNSAGSHRRRSPQARKTGGNNIEQTTFALNWDIPNQGGSTAASVIASTGNEVDDEDTEIVKNAKTGKKAATGNSNRDKSSSPKVKVASNKGKRVYKILLFSSTEFLKADDKAFKGLRNVSHIHENNEYKYTFGESTDKEEMDRKLTELSDLFPQARVIQRYK